MSETMLRTDLHASQGAARRGRTPSLTAQIFIGLVAGILVGYAWPGVGVGVKPLADVFLRMIKMIIAPLVFATLVVGIAGTGDLKAMGRIGLKAIVYFEIATTIALFLGLGLVDVFESTALVMFKFTAYVMAFAPIGVFAAIAATVGGKGLAILLTLGKLIALMYLGLAVFALIVLGAVSYLIRVPFFTFVKAIREPFLIAFSTASSEAALPKALEVMERFGVPKNIVGFVLPTGYSFNLDGSTLYLSLASVFVAQLAGVQMTIGDQIKMMLTLMVTSKGVAGVPRAALVVLTATLAQFKLPLEGAAILLAIDQILDMGRTSVNVMGNCLATAVVARWEGVFDDAKMRK